MDSFLLRHFLKICCSSFLSSNQNLAGKPFSACVEYFPAAVAIGVVASDGSVILLPDNDYPLSADTEIIVVAEDDDAYEALEYPYQIDVGELPERKVRVFVEAPKSMSGRKGSNAWRRLQMGVEKRGVVLFVVLDGHP